MLAVWVRAPMSGPIRNAVSPATTYGLRGQLVNDKGQVTVTDLANYIQQQLADWAQTYRGKQQTFWLNLQGSASLVLTGTFLFVAARSRLCLRIGSAYTFASTSMNNNYTR